jgi:transcriptional regulator with XRE-family HTH domain
MSETKHYEDERRFQFEWTSQGDAYKGILVTRYPELEPFTAEVNLSKSRSCNEYASRAQEICGMSKSALKVALNALCSKRHEEMAAAREAEESEAEQEETHPQVSQEQIDERVGRPGVLDRFVEASVTCSRVIGERKPLGLISLAGLSAQLAPLPNGRPLGANVILTSPPGRGKNYLCDAVARLLPGEFCFPFESASAKALYYAAAQNPEFLRHRWVYPNEAEGADLLVEVLRPLLSGGSARHVTVNKDATGRNVGEEFRVEGPATVTIPTVRNKLDSQLQSRMLIADLKDYEGRVAAHSGAVSEQLSPGYAATDYSGEVCAWQEALRTLTALRKVVVPVEDERFRFDSDKVPHGARLWANLLALMSAHAWLEQKNREVRDLPNGERAIVAAPEDYLVAYEVFKETCERSIVNLSETHRKILDAAYRLQRDLECDEEWDAWKGLTQRKLAEKAGVSQSTVSENKTFLVKSAKFLRETREGGLALVEGAEPSWWEKGDALTGFPRPEEVRAWWSGDTSPTTPEGADHADHNLDRIQSPHGQGAKGDRHPADQGQEAADQPWASDRSSHPADREDDGGDWIVADREFGLFEEDDRHHREAIRTIDGLGDEGAILSGASPSGGEGVHFDRMSDAVRRQGEDTHKYDLCLMPAKDALQAFGWTCTMNFAEVSHTNSSESSSKDQVDVTRDPVTLEIRARLYRYLRYAKSTAEVFDWKFDIANERRKILEYWPATPEEMHGHLQMVALALQGERPFYADSDIIKDDRIIRVQYWEKVSTGQGLWVFAVFGGDGPSDHLMEKTVWEKVQKVENLMIGDADW